MSEPFDIYSDSFTISISPWGACMSYKLNEPHPAPASPKPSKEIGTVRMSNEHLKTMLFLCVRQMKGYERDNGVRCEVPTQILAQLGIAREDWDDFWRHMGG